MVLHYGGDNSYSICDYKCCLSFYFAATKDCAGFNISTSCHIKLDSLPTDLLSKVPAVNKALTLCVEEGDD